MDTLRKQVRRAQRRLMLQQFLIALTWSLFGTLLIAAIAVAVPKIWALPVRGDLWALGWIGGALGAGCLIAAAWTYWTRHDSLDAALEIDRRFELKERVSSALALDDDEAGTEAGRALLRDAARRVDRLDVDERFAIRLNRQALLPLAPAAVVFVLVLFIGDRALDNVAGASTTAAQAVKQIQQPAKALVKKIEEKQLQAKEQGLKDAEGLFKKIEEGAKELAAKEDADRKKALIKLNDLAKELEERQKQLGGDDKLKEQLKNLKDMKGGPADKMAQALKDGNFKKAIDEVEKLKDQLAKGNLSDEKKAELAKQLEDMQKKMKQMADAHKEAQDKLQKQIEQLKNSGQTEQANKLQQQLDKLAGQNQQMDQLQKMADKLGQAAEGMKSGKPGEAQQALNQLQNDLQQLQQENSEIEMIGDALQQLAQAKDAMNCQACQGGGCQDCQGDLLGMGQGQGKGKSDQKGGMGMGEGRGRGARPEQKTDTNTRDTIARQKVGPGGAVLTGEIEGPNVKGNVQQRIQEAIEGGARESDDPLNNQRLPRNQRDHVKEYFDTIRGG